MDYDNVSRQTIIRLPSYLNYLKNLTNDRYTNISATIIANALGLNDVQVRKDLSVVSSAGKPKVGYNREELIKDIESFLGYDTHNRAVLVGAGNLGQALLSHDGFSKYGIDIVAAFDKDADKAGMMINGREVRPIEELSSFCKRNRIRIGVLTVPEERAQEACDCMLEAGIDAILNYAQVYLVVPAEVKVETETVAYAISQLINHIR